MIFRQVPLRCVVCPDRPELARVDERALVQCQRCRAVWMEETDFLTLLRRHQPGKRVDELIEHDYDHERHPCPVCDERMNVVWIEYLAFERCAHHGVWLAEEELERALAWKVASDKVTVITAPPDKRGAAFERLNEQIKKYES